MNYYKITSEDEMHHGLQYKDGLVADPLSFQENGNYVKGGIYFAREDILAFLRYGPWLREVMLPDDARVVKDPGGPPTKWRADKVVLGPRKPINAEIIRELIEAGANVHANDDEALRWAASNGNVKLVNLLIEAGANIYANNDEALEQAVKYGHIEVVRSLIKAGTSCHVCDNETRQRMAKSGYAEAVNLLSKLKQKS